MVVYRYSLINRAVYEPGLYTSAFQLPVGAIPLSVGVSPHGVPSLWCLIDEAEFKTEPREFVTYFTGTGGVSKTSTYIGTFQKDCLVYHVFEKKLDGFRGEAHAQN